MSTDTIRERICAAAKELKPEAEVKPDVNVDDLHLMEDFQLDSLDLINLLFTLENDFSLKIPEPDIGTFELLRVGNLAEYISKNSSNS